MSTSSPSPPGSDAPEQSAAVAALTRHFGFRAFLDGQERAVSAILEGSDTLIVMPTGGGKSLCYQLPAMVLEGITIVVSPLIALMKDQVDGLTAKGVPATFINSALDAREIEQRIERMRRGDYRLVYIAPERFKSARFVQALAPLSVALFAIDEAHCISQWGHDFRPDYLRLKPVLAQLGQPQVAALTATATPEVRDDILVQLGLGVDGRRAPQVLVSGFARGNLTLVVTHVHTAAEKLARISAAVAAVGSGIVYCATRKNVERVAQSLSHADVRCIAYHGGMTDEQRNEAQDAFMRGEIPLAVATNALGMGVDRADVRCVIHHDIPGSVEAYYQEAGRAGRDGEPAWCELLYNYADVRTQEFFVAGANPGREDIAQVYAILQRLCAAGPIEMPITQIAELLGKTRNTMTVGGALHLLEKAGAIQREYAQGSRTHTTHLVTPIQPLDALAIDFARLEAKRSRDDEKLHRMIAYAEHKGCRHGFILTYFGDLAAPTHCATCDYCLAHRQAAARLPTADEQLAVRKALSCIARLDGCYGRGRIAQVLVGSRAKEVLDAGLDQLTTYALLADEGSEYVWELLEALIAAGCIAVSTGKYPTLSLTPLGHEVMHARSAVALTLPAAPAARPARSRDRRVASHAAAPAEDADSAALLQALRAWRRDEAAARGVPAYHIYTDSTLHELARHQPQTNLALLNIRGIGPAKARQFGAATLEIVRNKFFRGEII
ncbi:MAG: ATP-dependent DNA helicase [bacterium]|nr:ATP-dependent DNA helicase [bacterium]